MDAQRRYLGGDSDHSILVKGLDFALLEQNKAKLASVSSKQDDEALEEVFVQTSSSAPEAAANPKKRSRADLIQELKEKRKEGGGKAAAVPEGAVDVDKSKFKPIGFKPIGSSSKGEKGKKKTKDEGERKKKKRKVGSADAGGGPVEQDAEFTAAPSAAPTTGANYAVKGPGERLRSSAGPEPEPVDEEFDIFAGAGEYKGLGVDSDSDSDSGEKPSRSRRSSPRRSAEPDPSALPPTRRGWFDDEPEPEATTTPAAPPGPRIAKSRSRSPAHEVEEGEEEEESVARLAPLASSALPSIKDFLAMDEEAEKQEQRRARKEKKKGKGGGGGGGDKDKLERDYQRSAFLLLFPRHHWVLTRATG